MVAPATIEASDEAAELADGEAQAVFEPWGEALNAVSGVSFGMPMDVDRPEETFDDVVLSEAKERVFPSPGSG